MENERKNELMLNTLQSGLFDESKVKKLTTLDINDENESTLLLNSMQDCEFKLNDCVGKVIEIVGCYVTEREREEVNEENGEIYIRKSHTLMLFDTDGKAYVTGSNSCFMSFKDIVSLKGLPTKENHLVVEPIKVPAKNKEHSYLKLKLVTNKK